jgi:hypothetical protein
MKTRFSLLLALFVVQGAKSQYCTTAGPTSTADSNVESVFLSGTSGTISYTGCPGVVGVQNLSGTQSVTLTAGQTYTITIDFGTCGGNYSGAGQAWIDYDLSGTFDPTESLGTWAGIPPAAPQNFVFTVPANAQSGNSRLRVIQHEAGTIPLDPCASFTWGSAVDFGIVITGGVDCSGYQGDIVEDAIPVTTIPYTTTGNTSYCYFNQNLVYNSPDIYYRLITTPNMVDVTVSLCGSSFDTFLSVIDPQGNVVAYNDDGSCGTSSELTFSALGQDTLYIIVEGWGSAMGNYNLTIESSMLGLASSSAPTFTIFPNPAKDQVQLLGAQHANLRVTTMNGQFVQAISDYSGEPISIADFSPGIYFIEVTADQSKGITKLIVSE